MESLETPCVKVCTYDAGAGLCRGCGRSLEEIAAWGSMSAQARHTVMQELPNRLRCMVPPAG